MPGGTIGPAGLQHIDHIWVARGRPLQEAEGADDVVDQLFFFFSPNLLISSPRTAVGQPPGSSYDNVGVRLLDLLGVNGDQCIATHTDNQSQDSVFREV